MDFDENEFNKRTIETGSASEIEFRDLVSEKKSQKTDDASCDVPFPNTRKVMMKFVAVDVEIPGTIMYKEAW